VSTTLPKNRRNDVLSATEIVQRQRRSMARLHYEVRKLTTLMRPALVPLQEAVLKFCLKKLIAESSLSVDNELLDKFQRDRWVGELTDLRDDLAHNVGGEDEQVILLTEVIDYLKGKEVSGVS
jgi:hypothetical protein